MSGTDGGKYARPDQGLLASAQTAREILTDAIFAMSGTPVEFLDKDACLVDELDGGHMRISVWQPQSGDGYPITLECQLAVPEVRFSGSGKAGADVSVEFPCHVSLLRADMSAAIKLWGKPIEELLAQSGAEEASLGLRHMEISLFLNSSLAGSTFHAESTQDGAPRFSLGVKLPEPKDASAWRALLSASWRSFAGAIADSPYSQGQYGTQEVVWKALPYGASLVDGCEVLTQAADLDPPDKLLDDLLDALVLAVELHGGLPSDQLIGVTSGSPTQSKLLAILEYFVSLALARLLNMAAHPASLSVDSPSQPFLPLSVSLPAFPHLTTQDPFDIVVGPTQLDIAENKSFWKAFSLVYLNLARFGHVRFEDDSPASDPSEALASLHSAPFGELLLPAAFRWRIAKVAPSNGTGGIICLEAWSAFTIVRLCCQTRWAEILDSLPDDFSQLWPPMPHALGELELLSQEYADGNPDALLESLQSAWDTEEMSPLGDIPDAAGGTAWIDGSAFLTFSELLVLHVLNTGLRSGRCPELVFDLLQGEEPFVEEVNLQAPIDQAKKQGLPTGPDAVSSLSCPQCLMPPIAKPSIRYRYAAMQHMVTTMETILASVKEVVTRAKAVTDRAQAFGTYVLSLKDKSLYYGAQFPDSQWGKNDKSSIASDINSIEVGMIQLASKLAEIEGILGSVNFAVIEAQKARDTDDFSGVCKAFGSLDVPLYGEQQSTVCGEVSPTFCKEPPLGSRVMELTQQAVNLQQTGYIVQGLLCINYCPESGADTTFEAKKHQADIGLTFMCPKQQNAGFNGASFWNAYYDISEHVAQCISALGNMQGVLLLPRLPAGKPRGFHIAPGKERLPFLSLQHRPFAESSGYFVLPSDLVPGDKSATSDKGAELLREELVAETPPDSGAQCLLSASGATQLLQWVISVPLAAPLITPLGLLPVWAPAEASAEDGHLLTASICLDKLHLAVSAPGGAAKGFALDLDMTIDFDRDPKLSEALDVLPDALTPHDMFPPESQTNGLWFPDNEFVDGMAGWKQAAESTQDKLSYAAAIAAGPAVDPSSCKVASKIAFKIAEGRARLTCSTTVAAAALLEYLSEATKLANERGYITNDTLDNYKKQIAALSGSKSETAFDSVLPLHNPPPVRVWKISAPGKGAFSGGHWIAVYGTGFRSEGIDVFFDFRKDNGDIISAQCESVSVLCPWLLSVATPPVPANLPKKSSWCVDIRVVSRGAAAASAESTLEQAYAYDASAPEYSWALDSFSTEDLRQAALPSPTRVMSTGLWSPPTSGPLALASLQPAPQSCQSQSSSFFPSPSKGIVYIDIIKGQVVATPEDAHISIALPGYTYIDGLMAVNSKCSLYLIKEALADCLAIGLLVGTNVPEVLGTKVVNIPYESVCAERPMNEMGILLPKPLNILAILESTGNVVKMTIGMDFYYSLNIEGGFYKQPAYGYLRMTTRAVPDPRRLASLSPELSLMAKESICVSPGGSFRRSRVEVRAPGKVPAGGRCIWFVETEGGSAVELPPKEPATLSGTLGCQADVVGSGTNSVGLVANFVEYGSGNPVVILQYPWGTPGSLPLRAVLLWFEESVGDASGRSELHLKLFGDLVSPVMTGSTGSQGWDDLKEFNG